ncbi:MAG: methyltransferase domain-containing protein [Prolixibacteraceae bacterium]|jgi:tellurite methyltransferase|nr:methyltransferase domain-containing protein [Prolixibacteraceae bacterium]MBT6006684.1 methyltransferase domain-containing protein [Prolixibacteraceae bacterium]MBT6765710.1 methyltransferase domain-containing protein [Prolixibacteraceae bacterium]MBT6998535.1 methyltransferase domain-containing protein [Prolixibacteraceae bacterium]MBT7397288.1 methyltransferase domain-containing protein [Prolixibacteraceae bacterium]
MTDYDKYYTTEDLFGEPYSVLIDFFKQYEPKGKLIDLGCGQGRNSIPLSRLGYKVAGLDNSKIGVNQMIEKSNIENLKITGFVGDIYGFDTFQDFDIVLLDSMFHFEKRDMQKETGLIKKIAKRIKTSGLICICIQDTGAKVRILKDTIKKTKLDFDILNDSSLIYNYEDIASGHKSKTKYCMFIVKKK